MIRTLDDIFKNYMGIVAWRITSIDAKLDRAKFVGRIKEEAKEILINLNNAKADCINGHSEQYIQGKIDFIKEFFNLEEN